MDIQCPFCKQWTSANARRCASCNAPMEKKCPYCAEKIHILATRCRFCQSELTEGGLRPHAGP